MLAVPRYMTPSAGCLSLSNNIHNGQQVNKLGGFTCSSEQDIKKSQRTKPHLFTVCYIPTAGLPTVSVANQRHEYSEKLSHNIYLMP